MQKMISLLFALTATLSAYSQSVPDTLHVQPKKLKLHHAEPLYLDLIRDLGARKGEKELNFGMGIEDYKKYNSYSGFVEYEFAPADRLGVEVEIPFRFFQRVDGVTTTAMPQNRIEGVKLATQYTFLVSNKYQTSMAVGYIQEFEFSSFSTIDHQGKFLEGTLYNPIFIVAKRWTPAIHTLLYTGPVFEQHFTDNRVHTLVQVNANLHYVFPGSGNFVGLETNMEFSENKPSVIFRPQIKLKISDGVAIGCLAGIPARSSERGLSIMTRLIWEP